jgi:hypothetical protein
VPSLALPTLRPIPVLILQGSSPAGQRIEARGTPICQENTRRESSPWATRPMFEAKEGQQDRWGTLPGPKNAVATSEVITSPVWRLSPAMLPHWVLRAAVCPPSQPSSRPHSSSTYGDLQVDPPSLKVSQSRRGTEVAACYPKTQVPGSSPLQPEARAESGQGHLPSPFWPRRAGLKTQELFLP